MKYYTTAAFSISTINTSTQPSHITRANLNYRQRFQNHQERKYTYCNTPSPRRENIYLWATIVPPVPSSSDQEEAVNRMKLDLQLLEEKQNQGDDESTILQLESSIQASVNYLETSTQTIIGKDDESDNNEGRFEPLLGLYNVSYVQTVNKKDNPVGGKWTRKNKLAQKIFSTRRTLQHLVPTNSTGLGSLKRRFILKSSSSSNNGDVEIKEASVVAEAVNVISLDAFWNLLRLNVILRGDAVPLTVDERNSSQMSGKLSNLAVRAYFDAPRIILGKGRWLNLQLGPSTSVVLDTTYIDKQARIGKGGVSGTKFVFLRCDKDDDEAGEFKGLLQTRKMRTSKVLTFIGIFGTSGVWSLSSRGFRVAAGAVGLMSSLFALAIGFSTGGVEDDGMNEDLDKK